LIRENEAMSKEATIPSTISCWDVPNSIVGAVTELEQHIHSKTKIAGDRVVVSPV
jgi:hypothetical protein